VTLAVSLDTGGCGSGSDSRACGWAVGWSAAQPQRPMSSLRAGIRAGVPYAIAGGVFSFTFGVTARPLIGSLAAIVMSVVCFAGASQFAALAVLAAGGDALTAVVIGTLVNLRFVPMGISIAPWMNGGPVWRAVRSQAIADPSWVMARRSGSRYDIDFMTGSTIAQYITWVSGTAIGVAVGPLLGDTNRFGLDVVFPAFMLGLLASELTNGRARVAAGVGAAIALALTPILPAGLPIAAATAATVIGLRR
jgi:4-azaleucine resistance transporter AzlC